MTSDHIAVSGEGQLRIGRRVSLGTDIQVIFQEPAELTIGDYCSIAPGVKLICAGGDIRIGDWTTLHDGCLVMSGAGVEIGQHGWFGQYTVLDGTGGLVIGNGVRVGMYSQIWSHVAAGEQIEGCTLFGMRPVCIEDDVWLVGSCIVASGVTLGRRTVALIGSNITRSWPANSVIAGSPAAAKANLSFYRSIAPQEQWDMLLGWLKALAGKLVLRCLDDTDRIVIEWADDRNDEAVIFVRDAGSLDNALKEFPGATVCCLATKRYVKRLTELEQRVLKALSGNKARFIGATPSSAAAAVTAP